MTHEVEPGSMPLSDALDQGLLDDTPERDPLARLDAAFEGSTLLILNGVVDEPPSDDTTTEL